MTIEQALGELKTRIRFHIQNEVDAFEKVTGITPSDIIISMSEVTTPGDVGKKYVVDEVRVRLER